MIQCRLGAPPDAGPVPAVLALFPDMTKEQVNVTSAEWQGNHRFFYELNCKFFARRSRRLQFSPKGEFLYLIVRLQRPAVMVETGVFDGISSSIILQAMEDNGAGSLVSIDLPAHQPIAESTDAMKESVLPDNCDPGWLIPEYLRHRHRLELGDSRKILPEILEKQSAIDVFLHDSLHSSEHMRFEFEIAWPCLRSGGLLLSDDATWNPAFHTFSRLRRRSYVRVDDFAAMRK
jgi:predicted O-methyltransferase YrrM